MQILHGLLNTLPDGKVLDVRVGLHWTAVVADVGGLRQCGLASTLSAHEGHDHEPAVPQAGQLTRTSGRALAEMALSTQPTQASIGMAAINALLPRLSSQWKDDNAETVLARVGADKQVALVGHFPFVPRLREQVRELWVLEQNPQPGDLSAEMASEVIPQANVVAITGMTLTNRTLDGLLSLCPVGAFVMLLGPSVPLSPLLFQFGIRWISGAVVTEIDAVLNTLSQGGTFRQIHRAGVRLVNMQAI